MKYVLKQKVITHQIPDQIDFMSVFQNRMTHCPKCSKPLLNSGQFWGWAEFCLRCPWCQASVEVAIQPKITVSLKAPGQSDLNPGKPVFHSPSEEYRPERQQAAADENKNLFTEG